MTNGFEVGIQRKCSIRLGPGFPFSELIRDQPSPATDAEVLVPGRGSLFFGDPIFPITLEKLPHTQRVSQRANPTHLPHLTSYYPQKR